MDYEYKVYHSDEDEYLTAEVIERETVGNWELVSAVATATQNAFTSGFKLVLRRPV